MGLAHDNGITIHSTCNGMPSCAECRVKVVDGDWNLNPPSRKELGLIGTGYYIDQRRLSCQMLCFGDVTVDVAEQLEKASEGPVTKKFLTKVHKATAAESHSLGGVLIEQDQQLLKDIEKDVKVPTEPGMKSEAVTEGRSNRGDRGGRGGGGGGGGNRGAGRGDRGGNRGGGNPQNRGGQGGQQGQGGGGEGGGGRNRRRRGGRGRGGGGGGGGGGNRGGGGGAPQG